VSTPLRLGTRGSALALAQSQLTADALTAATGRPVELVRIVTQGDVGGAIGRTDAEEIHDPTAS